MAKRISEKQKQEIIEDFIKNKSLDEISKKFNFTKLTISRNLKKNLGDKKYYELVKLSKFSSRDKQNNDLSDGVLNVNESNESFKKDLFSDTDFLEIAPLDLEIDNVPQKDFSSISISQVDLPKIVFMIVDSKIELKPRLLKEFIKWDFLSEDELNRKTIEIYFDLKVARRSITKEQKVIKVPNSDVFKIAAPILLSRGISRIVCSDLLIAL